MIKYIPDKQKYLLHCEKCENTFEGAGCTVNSKLRLDLNPCTFCNPTPKYIGTSNLEKAAFDFVKANAGEMAISFHDRTIIPVMEADPNLSEAQIMHDAGHYRTFECGNWKYGLKLDEIAIDK